MNPNLRVCLIVAGVLVFLLGLVIIGSGTLIYLNRDKLKQGAQKIAQNLEKHADAGRAFGETSDQQGCLDEALARAEGAASLTALGPSIFFKSCLRTAAVSEGFCDGTPESTPSQIFSIATWPQTQCVEAGLPNNQACLQIMGDKLEHCLQPQAE